MTKIKIGNEVRSFDFRDKDVDGKNACFVQGKVVAIERPEGGTCDCYKIKTTKRVFGGKEVEEFEPIYYAPVNGTQKFGGGVCDGVELVNDRVEWMKEMMSSCFAYHSLSKDNSYLSKYKVELGEELFNEVYDTYEEFLKNTYTIKNDVYTDHEGCTYNTLVEK